MQKDLMIVMLLLLLLQLLQCVVCLERPPRSDDPDPLQVIVEQQANVIDQLQTKLTALEARLATQEKKVAFNARLVNTGGQSVLTDQQAIVFHVVDVNQGHGYDTLTGVFTAPVSGMYQVHLKVTHIPPGNMHIHVMKGQHPIAETDSSGDAAGDRSSTGVVVHLAVGERVWVKRDSGTATQLSGSFGTTFSGFLISAD